jgi:hypothetical protein
MTISLSRRGVGTAAALLLAACAPGAQANVDADAAAWSAGAAIPSAGALSMHDHRVAALAAGPDGALHALFLDDADGDGRTDRLLHARLADGRWSPVSPLASAAAIDQPALVVSGGAVHALWLSGDAGDAGRLATLRHRAWRDGAWTPAETAYRAEGSDGIPPALAAWGERGEIRAVLHDAQGRLTELASGDAPASGWRQADRLDGDGMEPTAASGAAGAVALAGLSTFPHPLETGGASNDPWVRARLAGRWGPAVRVHASPREHSHAPRVARTPDGALHAVWLEGDRGSVLPTLLLHAASADGGATWSPAETIASAPAGGSLYGPRLVVDGAGTLHVAFAAFRTGMSDPRHLHARLAKDAWTRPAPLLPAAGPRDSEVETTADAAGRLHAVWKAADGTYRHAVLAG